MHQHPFSFSSFYSVFCPFSCFYCIKGMLTPKGVREMRCWHFKMEREDLSQCTQLKLSCVVFPFPFFKG